MSPWQPQEGSSPSSSRPRRRIESSTSVERFARSPRELSVLESSLSTWVRDERRRIEALSGTSDEPLTTAERAELVRLRRQVSEQDKDLAFLGKAAAYFASNPPKTNGSR